jgi:hypothetical protein
MERGRVKGEEGSGGLAERRLGFTSREGLKQSAYHRCVTKTGQNKKESRIVSCVISLMNSKWDKKVSGGFIL